MRSSYITIDLDIESSEDLSTLANAMDSDEVLVHYCGSDGSSFRITLGVAGLDIDAEQAVGIYSNYIALRKELLSVLKPRITFNVGYEATEDSNVYHSTLSRDSIKEIARLGGDVKVTLYRKSTERSNEQVRY